MPPHTTKLGGQSAVKRQTRSKAAGGRAGGQPAAAVGLGEKAVGGGAGGLSAVGLGEFVGTAPSGPTPAAVAERTLRLFDLDTAYGPCACISRRERWERAERLGLSPPAEVLSLLAVPGVSQEGLWFKRL